MDGSSRKRPRKRVFLVSSNRFSLSFSCQRMVCSRGWREQTSSSTLLYHQQGMISKLWDFCNKNLRQNTTTKSYEFRTTQARQEAMEGFLSPNCCLRKTRNHHPAASFFKNIFTASLSFIYLMPVYFPEKGRAKYYHTF